MKLYITLHIIFNLLFLNIPSVDEPHIITNETDIEYLEEIVKIGLDELKIGKVRVSIRPMDRHVKYVIESRTNQILDAFIKGNNKHYIIYIGSFSKRKSTEILAHELIHLKQYYTKELRLKKDTLVYKDKSYYHPRYIDYRDRPWESDAFHEGKDLKITIQNRMEL